MSELDAILYDGYIMARARACEANHREKYFNLTGEFIGAMPA